MAESLYGAMDIRQSFCLNQHPQYPFSNLFVGDETLACRSDADGQMLINIVFRNRVKIQSISIGAPNDDRAPTTVKLFCNLPNPGFSDAEENEPAQILTLNPSTLTPDTKIPLKLVKFQNVNSLTIYIEENGGADFTEIYALKVLGNSLDTLNVAAIHEHKHEH